MLNPKIDPINDIQPASTTWRKAILNGQYLYGRTCRVEVTSDGKIVDCDILHSVLSGTDGFDRWFRDVYNPFVVSEPVG